jgi:hypothetical protein
MTFPNGDLMERLRVVSASFRLEPTQEIRRQAGGTIQARDLGPNLWYARISSVCRSFRELAEVEALLDALNGAVQPFHVYDPFKAYPATDPAGEDLGSATPTLHTIDDDNKRIRVQALPAGYKLTLGDLLAFDYGTSSRALHRVVEIDGATADGSGLTPLFEVRPHIRSGAAASDPVYLAKPAAVMRLLPGTVSIEASAGGKGASFEAVQVL